MKEHKVNLHLEKIKEEPQYAHLTAEQLQDMLKLTVAGIKNLESNPDFNVNKCIKQQHKYLKEKEKQLLKEIKLKEKNSP